MKRILLITVLITGLIAGYSFAQMGGDMMGKTGSRSKYKTDRPYYGKGYYPCPQMMGQGMMGYGGYGMMGPGMMGMGPGMMGHMGGMMGSGMMGYGRGYGMQGYDAEEYQEYMDKTSGSRKKLHNKRFDYFEAARDSDTDRKTLMKLEKEIRDLQWEIYEKAPR